MLSEDSTVSRPSGWGELGVRLGLAVALWRESVAPDNQRARLVVRGGIIGSLHPIIALELWAESRDEQEPTDPHMPPPTEDVDYQASPAGALRPYIGLELRF